MKVSVMSTSFLALVFVLGFVLTQGCSEKTSDDLTGGNNLTPSDKLYFTPREGDMLHDTRLRESAPDQPNGTITTIWFGHDGFGDMNLLYLDSSVSFLDSIPNTSEILACTLWVKISMMPMSDGDSVLLDLWNCTEVWSERLATWNTRVLDTAWSAAGGTGSIVSHDIIKGKRLDLFNFEWWVGDILLDTFTIAEARYLPIPLDPIVAKANLDKSSHGFLLKNSVTTTPGAFFTLVASEANAQSNHPYISWRYRN